MKKKKTIIFIACCIILILLLSMNESESTKIDKCDKEINQKEMINKANVNITSNLKQLNKLHTLKIEFSDNLNKYETIDDIYKPVEGKINYVEHDNAPKNTMKTYMSYKAITKKNSPQYKLQQVAYTGTYGIRQINERFCIALGSAYTTTVGNYVDIVLENGEVIECILADLKQDRHTDETNRVAHDGSLVEFVVDMDYITNRVRVSGDVSVACNEWNSRVVKVIVYDKVEDF